MIQNDLSTQLQLLIKTSAPPLLEVSQQQLELPQLVPGQKVPAFVVANLPNGRFQVLIADKTLDMNLPKNTQPGDTVDLVFVTTKPRLTFVLASDLANVANTTNAANTKPQVSLSDTARFLGGLLEKAAQPDSTNSATKGMATAVSQASPLLPGAPVKMLDFAQALRGALTQSGLFYESHQAQWVTGQRPLTDLLREPQGRLSPAAANLMQAGLGGSATHPGMAGTPSAQANELPQQLLSPHNPNETQLNKTLAINRPAPEQTQQQSANLPQMKDAQLSKPVTNFLPEPTGRPSAAASAYQAQAAHGVPPSHPGAAGTSSAQAAERPNSQSPNSQTAMAGAPNTQAAEQRPQLLPNPQHSIDVQSSKAIAPGQMAHPDTLPLVRQQLEALDSRQVTWQGQVWPGQTMDWTVEERAARGQDSEIEIPVWHTSLRLVLPQLGEILAKLTFQHQGIRIQLDASELVSAKLLAEQRIALQQGMETSGLQLVEMKVRHETEG